MVNKREMPQNSGATNESIIPIQKEKKKEYSNHKTDEKANQELQLEKNSHGYS